MIRPRKTVEEMPRYDPPLEGRRDKLRLDFNENTQGPSPKALEVLRNATPEMLSTYPEYADAYGFFARHWGVDISNILATNGTDEAIRIIFNTFINEGDVVVLPAPSYALFELESVLFGADIRRVYYNDDLSFPVERMAEAAKGAKLVVVVNPNNPTGTSVPQDAIARIASEAELVLVDEAYSEFNKTTALPLLEEMKNIILTRTFSKAFGLAGLRLGFAISSPEIISTLKKVASPYSVNTLALACAMATLKDNDYIARYVDEVIEARAELIEGLKEMGFDVFDSEANFVVCRIGKDAGAYAAALREQGILVRDRSSYPLLEGCIRMGVGTRDQVRTLLDALKGIKGAI